MDAVPYIEDRLALGAAPSGVEDAAGDRARCLQQPNPKQLTESLCEVAPLWQRIEDRTGTSVLRFGPGLRAVALGSLEPAVRIDDALAVPVVRHLLARGQRRRRHTHPLRLMRRQTAHPVVAPVAPSAVARPARLEHAALVFDLNSIFFLFFIAQFFIPLLQKRMLAVRRQAAIRAIEQSRHSRLITMIHRQETMSILGFPVARYIDIEDSEDVLRAIRFTPPDMPIDLLLHTPGGLVLASEQIAYALKHPQLGTAQSSFAAASVMKALSQPNPNREDTTLILGDLAEKALRQVHATVRKLLAEHHSEADAERIASALADGQWTHDYPLDVDALNQLGIAVGTELPRPVYDLMDLYPQTSQRRPGVEFIPIPYPQRTTEPAKKER